MRPANAASGIAFACCFFRLEASMCHFALAQPIPNLPGPDIDINAIWFASGGLLIIAIGALDLLRVAYSSVAKGTYVVSVIANIVLLVLMLFIATGVPMRSNPQVLVGLILAALPTAFSVLRRASHIQARQMQSAKSSVSARRHMIGEKSPLHPQPGGRLHERD